MQNDLISKSKNDFKSRLLNSKNLNLAGFCLAKIPPIIFELGNLEKLILSFNFLEEIEMKIHLLSNLLHLHLDRNNLTSYPDSISFLPKIKNLNLSYNKISHIDSEIGELSELTILKLRATNINKLPREISQLINLEELDLGRNGFEEIPNQLFELNKLKILRLDYNYIKFIPDEISNLTGLEELYINANKIDALPSSILKLKKIRLIEISGNENIEIDDNLLNRKELIIISNEKYVTKKFNPLFDSLANFDKKLGKIFKSKMVYSKSKDFNKMKPLRLPKFVIEGGRLIFDIYSSFSRSGSNKKRFVKSKVIFSNDRTSVIVFGGTVDNNIFLNCNKGVQKLTIISSIVRSSIFKLKLLENLDELVILNCRIKRIAHDVLKLRALEFLDMSENNIKNVPAKINTLTKLRVLRLADNNIKEIPSNIALMDNLDITDFSGNPLVNPPQEISSQGIDAIKTYFKSISNADVERLNEAKLILVGDGEVGKTSIARKLINIKSKLPSIKERTHGLDVYNWKIELDDKNKFNFNIWDFGGQGKYRTIQQFFCTRNSLYLYVENPQKEQKRYVDKYSGFNYWLNFISAYGYDDESSSKSPIIYITNKIDLVFNNVADKEISSKGFENIIAFAKISCVSGIGIEDLKETIKDHIEKVGFYNVEFNSNWIGAKKDLELLKKDYISLKDYYSICENNELSLDEAKIWLSYLNAIGTLLYFPNIASLKTLVVLSPNWVKNAAYNVLNFPLAFERGGRICNDDFEEIWSDFDEELHSKLIDLMISFELCYKVRDGNKDWYVIPSLFPSYDEIGFDEANVLPSGINEILNYTCTFKPFIPAGLLHRLIVRQNLLLSNDYWSTGCIFKKNNSVAIVNENWRKNSINVKFIGKEDEIINLLIIIRNEIEQICIKIHKEKYLKEFATSESINFEGRSIDLSDILKLGKTPYSLDQVEIKSGALGQFADVIMNFNGLSVEQLSEVIRLIKNSSQSKHD